MGASANGEDLVPVRNRIERSFLRYFYLIIPVTYAFRVTLEYADSQTLPLALTDSVKIVSELGLLIVFALANALFSLLGPTIASLLANGVIARQALSESDSRERPGSDEQALDSLLNHKARILIGTIAALATLGYYVTRIGGPSAFFNTTGSFGFFDLVLYVVPSSCYAYFVGIVAWKIIATSLFFQWFPNRYSVVPRFLHPDRAGGLLPIGNLCLRMIYIAVVPTLLSAAFILASFFTRFGMAKYFVPNSVLFGFIPLVLSLGLGGLTLGFLPLFRFHVAMTSRRYETIEQLAALAEKIIAAKLQILEAPSESRLEGLEARLKTLSDLESYYDAARKVHMWPVDTSVLARIWGSFILLAGQVAGLLELIRTVSK